GFHCTNSYAVLLPPASDFIRIPSDTISLISRKAVSGEHLAIAAHFVLVSLPSNPSSNRFNSLTCRSFIGVPAQRCQKRAFASTASSVDWALVTARSSVARNQPSHSVTSIVPFCVLSSTS